MSDPYTRLYQSKKEQLVGSNKSISDVKNSLESVSRSQTPLSRASSPQAPPSTPKKKIAYQNQLAEIKNDVIQVLEDNKKLLEDNRKSCEEMIDSKLTEHRLFIESIKTDNLKNAMNDIVKQFNENVKSVGSELLKQSESLEALKDRVDEIDELL